MLSCQQAAYLPSLVSKPLQVPGGLLAQAAVRLLLGVSKGPNGSGKPLGRPS